MSRPWAYHMALLLLGLTTAGLVRAWQPPAADMVAGMLPPAPAGYTVQVTAFEFPGSVIVMADYTPLGGDDGSEYMEIIVSGVALEELPEEPPEEEPPGDFPLPPCLPEEYTSSQGQRQGFQEMRLAMADTCPEPQHILYMIDIPFHLGDDYFYMISAERSTLPPFHDEGFQPLDALLDQIDLPALAALGA